MFKQKGIWELAWNPSCVLSACRPTFLTADCKNFIAPLLLFSPFPLILSPTHCSLPQITIVTYQIKPKMGGLGLFVPLSSVYHKSAPSNKFSLKSALHIDGMFPFHQWYFTCKAVAETPCYFKESKSWWIVKLFDGRGENVSECFPHRMYKSFCNEGKVWKATISQTELDTRLWSGWDFHQIGSGFHKMGKVVQVKGESTN